MSRMTTKEFYHVVSCLRNLFRWSSIHKSVLTQARVNGSYNRIKCAGCEQIIGTNEHAKDVDAYEKVHVDHIDPVGSFLKNRSLDYAAKRIFCEDSNLQALCHSCHYFKTQVDKEEMYADLL
jgi:hypothetical protein